MAWLYGQRYPDKWVIDDNAIYFNPEVDGTNGDLISVEQYSEFEFSLDWKVAPGSNSGIFYHVVESDAYEFPYETAPEMQVLDNDLHPDGVFKQHRAGDLYDLVQSSTENVRPVGEWNNVRIIVKGNLLQHWQNGEKPLKQPCGMTTGPRLLPTVNLPHGPGSANQILGI